MKEKTQRQEAILQIVGSGRIPNQDALIQALQQRGISATQATLSRDLRALNIAKRQDADGYVRYQLSKPAVRLRSDHIEAGILSLEFARGIGVIRVVPGYAPVIASRIDGSALSSVMGTVAGDDTVLFVLRGDASDEAAVAELDGIFPGIRTHLQSRRP